VLVLGVHAARGRPLAPGGVVEEREQGVVELQVRAAEASQRGDLVGVGGSQVGAELVPAGVTAAGQVGAEVGHARRGDGELGYRAGHGRGQEPEVVGEDGLGQVHVAGHLGPVGLVDRLSVAPEHGDGRPLRRVAQAAEARDEVGVPLGAAELAVGGRAQPGRLLHRDGVPDRIVLGLGELVRGDGPSPAVGAGAEQRGRAEQAPDVVGAERR